MAQGNIWKLIGLAPALAVSACAGHHVEGVAPGRGTHVASVKVIQNDPAAPAGFGHSLHDSVLQQSAPLGADGKPVALWIDVDKVQFKRPHKFWHRHNRANASVAVYDTATGQELGHFSVHAKNRKPPPDETAQADPNASPAADALRAKLTSETLRRTFGDDKVDAGR